MQTINVLVVDDNNGDIVLLKEALKEANCNVHLIMVATTAEALKRLHDQEDGVEIDLILLDFFMRGTTASVDLYRHVRAELGRIPVMIYTGTSLEQVRKGIPDIEENMYLAKANGVEQWESTVEQIKQVVREHLHLTI